MNQIICVQPISQSQQNNYLKLKYFIHISFGKDNIVVILHAQIFHSKHCLPSSRSCRLRQNIGRNAANMVSMGCQSEHNEGAEWPEWEGIVVIMRGAEWSLSGSTAEEKKLKQELCPAHQAYAWSFWHIRCHVNSQSNQNMAFRHIILGHSFRPLRIF